MTADTPPPDVPQLPLPAPDADNQGFWEACGRHELRLQRCGRCRAWRHPPRPMCPHCQALDYDWVAAGGGGTVYTFTIVHGPTLPVFQRQAPYSVAVVQLDEGPFMVSNVIDCAAEHLRIGLPVAVVFEDVGDGVSLPKFRPVSPANAAARSDPTLSEP